MTRMTQRKKSFFIHKNPFRTCIEEIDFIMGLAKEIKGIWGVLRRKGMQLILNVYLWYDVVCRHRCTWGRGGESKYVSHKNAINAKKGTLIRFSDKPKDPLKRIWPKPQGPPLDSQLLCIYVNVNNEKTKTRRTTTIEDWETVIYCCPTFAKHLAQPPSRKTWSLEVEASKWVQWLFVTDRYP